jgi:hypothetical protein
MEIKLDINALVNDFVSWLKRFVPTFFFGFVCGVVFAAVRLSNG